jgi:hypothetical protein
MPTTTDRSWKNAHNSAWICKLIVLSDAPLLMLYMFQHGFLVPINFQVMMLWWTCSNEVIWVTSCFLKWLSFTSVALKERHNSSQLQNLQRLKILEVQVILSYELSKEVLNYLSVAWPMVCRTETVWPCAHVISLFAKINLTSNHKIKECPRISLRIGLILYPEITTDNDYW